MKLVTAIMPTRGRTEYAMRALDVFIAQTYPEKELVILDDPSMRSFPSTFKFPDDVTYCLALHGGTIPAKRNFCCRLAHGDYIFHLDDDDYSVPDRMAAQVHLLEESGKKVTGFHSMYFHAQNGQWWFYRGYETYALGTSLCYTRAWQETHPFDETLPTGEDSAFVKKANKAHELITLDAGSMMFARAHAGNTSAKNLDRIVSQEYRRISAEQVPQEFNGLA